MLPIVAVAIGCLAGGALGELSLRTLIAFELLPGDNPFVSFVEKLNASGRIYRPSPDEILQLELVPNSGRRHIRINSLGFRGGEHPIQPPLGTIRVAFVGDSETFGAALEEEDTISKRVEAELNRLDPERRYEVLNLGFPGYNAEQSLRVVTGRAMALAPHVVVFYYVLNDPIPAERAQHIAQRRFYYHSYVGILLGWTFHSLIPTLDIYRKAHETRSVVGVYRDLHRAEAFEPVALGVRAVGRYLSEQGTKFVVAIAPEVVAFDAFDEYPYHEIHEQLRRLASEEVTVVDPLDALARSGCAPRDFWVREDDAHKNAMANALIAPRIASAVLERTADRGE